MGGLDRSGQQGQDKVLGVLWCPSVGHRNASTAPRCSPKVTLGPSSVLGLYSVSERCCLGGRGGKLKNSWFYSLSVKTDFKETSQQKLTVWNIWTFFKQSNLLTSIQVHRRLLRYCFQVWYKMREKHISERKITPLESLHIFALPGWVVQVSPRQKWWEGKQFKQRAKTCPHETRRTFLSCSPSHQTGQNLFTDL